MAKEKKDLFAEIAATRIAATQNDSRKSSLVEPKPPKLPRIFLPGAKSNPAAAFRPKDKLDTSEKLKGELKRQRRRYEKFLQDFAPRLESTRLKREIKEFDWRVQTKEDLANLSGPLNGAGQWEKIQIPHYGGPLGRAVTYYRTTFPVTKPMLEKGALFLSFKGVDYKAHVFINGVYLGSHEGFFAPFEFDCTNAVRPGDNILFIKVENDAICMGNASWGHDGQEYEGDKIYAATGPGYDDPQIGWHHCPPGMGIYQDLFIEARSSIHVHDIFVRTIPEENRAEAWIELYNSSLLRQEVSLEISVFGQNFQKTVFCNQKCKLPEPAGPTVNYFRIPFSLPNPKIWDLETPWLYQFQVTVVDSKDNTLDTAARQFGMRSFRMEEKKEPKGSFYLNGRLIRLRGANTMGFEQQCVIKKDWGQLRDDILLAKICHLNFWRLTQRPVQSEVYEFCDRLGLMTQTDLPLFGVLRKNQFCEAVRQAEEMERLVRNHPSNIMISYINEPFSNKLHRNLLRSELESFFIAADQVVRLANPDRVIKPVDGDYEPPVSGLPDNHCYNGWYNGHGLDLGKLNKGYWQKVKPGWFYGCGEFGSEGLDPVSVMRKYYPSDWLPHNAEEEKDWTPDQIISEGFNGAQTGRFHYMWFETQHTLAGWVTASQAHQARVTRLMTESFRRDNRMVSCAIHLFIDAFPDGWMKAIMDVERRPKPAYFAYREALTPLMANLRTDRYVFFQGEKISLEAWIFNDLNTVPRNTFLHYQVEVAGKTIFSQKSRAKISACKSVFQGFLNFSAPEIKYRSRVVVRTGLLTETGKVLHDTAISLDIFPKPGKTKELRAHIFGSRDGAAARLAKGLGLQPVFSTRIQPNNIILIDNFKVFTKNRNLIMAGVQQGATAIFLELPIGEFTIGGDKLTVIPCGMGPRHFVSRNSGHPFVADFKPDDFKFWYDPLKGCISPFLATTFTAFPDWKAILTSGNGVWGGGGWQPALAVAERKYGAGYFRVCQINLSDRISKNPVASLFARCLLNLNSI